ncbi:hypothetical protein OROMI_025985 [Orobanche minor]
MPAVNSRAEEQIQPQIGDGEEIGSTDELTSLGVNAGDEKKLQDKDEITAAAGHGAPTAADRSSSVKTSSIFNGQAAAPQASKKVAEKTTDVFEAYGQDVLGIIKKIHELYKIKTELDKSRQEQQEREVKVPHLGLPPRHTPEKKFDFVEAYRKFREMNAAALKKSVPPKNH